MGAVRLARLAGVVALAVLAGGSVSAPAAIERQSWIGHTSQHHQFGLGTFGRVVVGVNYSQTRLVCTGTRPHIDWVTVDGGVERLLIAIGADGAFGGSFPAGPVGNRLTVRGRFTGDTVTGTIVDTLYPVAATLMTSNTHPPHRVVGGVCRVTIGFTARRVGR